MSYDKEHLKGRMRSDILTAAIILVLAEIRALVRSLD